jgi:cytochrome bd-type quinol oxidase subunit 2
MKQVSMNIISRIAAVFMLCMVQVFAWAQDSTGTTRTVTTETTTTTTEWYSQPWVWIAGAAVFVLLMIALLRGNSSKDTEVSRTTVIKDR